MFAFIAKCLAVIAGIFIPGLGWIFSAVMFLWALVDIVEFFLNLNIF